MTTQSPEELILPAPARRSSALALFCCAMEEEARPFFNTAKSGGPVVNIGSGSLQLLRIHDATVALLVTGVGLVNAGSALATALTMVSPRYVIALGSAGGLGADVKVGDVILGTDFRFSTADATAFGYELGQIPSMPVSYSPDSVLFSKIAEAVPPEGVTVRSGGVISADAFVTGGILAEMRAKFPEAIVADMESAAWAQVCYLHEVAFAMVRGVSDLCDPEAAAGNSLKAEEVSARALQVALGAFGLAD